MRALLLFVLTCFYLPVFSQTPVEEEKQIVVCFGEAPPPHDSIFEIFDLQKPPVFPDGEKELLKFLAENFRWPKGCGDMDGVGAGTIVVQFVIDTLGQAVDLKIIKTPGKCFEPMVAEIFEKMPCWEPGELVGRKVRTRFVLPIRIHWE